MYAEDSFFTLSMSQRIGLLALTGLLSVLMIWLSRICTKSSRMGVRIVLPIVLFAVFVWAAPQVYYQYYLMIFDGLPIQWVVKWPPDLLEPFRYLSFTGPASFSAHGQGVLFWAMVLAANVRRSLPA